MSMQFEVKLHNDDYIWMPERANDEDAGFDLKARAIVPILFGELQDEISLSDGDASLNQTRVLVKTGVFLGLQPGYEAQIRPRSGMALKHGITITNSPGTIDAGYRNEIGVILQNTEGVAFGIYSGMRIAQMVICKLPTVCLVHVCGELDKTERGLKGFGSSGQ